MEYPGIVKATLEIAYDNGCINRERTEEHVISNLRSQLAHENVMDLPAIDAWLAALSGEDLGVVCAGEEEEMDALMAKSPPGTHDLLNYIFDHII